MGEVIKIARDESDPNEERHCAGKAKCLACGYEWAAVCPVGRVDALECPGCGLVRGSMKWPPYPADGTEVMVCSHCGCELFFITRQGWVCAGCALFKAMGPKA